MLTSYARSGRPLKDPEIEATLGKQRGALSKLPSVPLARMRDRRTAEESKEPPALGLSPTNRGRREAAIPVILLLGLSQNEQHVFCFSYTLNALPRPLGRLTRLSEN
jgi:hypothetical protein